ncbi:hypothetical protein CYMTET_35508, partial [Cymbomonas tetramitiformis]
MPTERSGMRCLLWHLWLCALVSITSGEVFPQNLRHFAFWDVDRDNFISSAEFAAVWKLVDAPSNTTEYIPVATGNVRTWVAKAQVGEAPRQAAASSGGTTVTISHNVSSHTQLHDAVEKSSVTKIILQADVRLTPETELAPVQHQLEILGECPNTCGIDANGLFRIFEVERGGQLSLCNLTLANGNATGASLTSESARGGAVLVQTDSILAAIDCAMRHCTATGGGGAVAAIDSTILMTRTRLVNNSGSFGGAVACRGSVCVLDGCTLEDNVAQISGGGLLAIPDGGVVNVTMTETAIRRNVALGLGGGGLGMLGSIEESSSNSASGEILSVVQLTRCLLQENAAPSSYAGGLGYLSPAVLGLSSSGASFRGDALPNTNEGPTVGGSSPQFVILLQEVAFHSNFAEADGGGIGLFFGQNTTHVRVVNCSFLANRALNREVASRNGGGGAISAYFGSHLLVEGSLFEANTADFGGALWSYINVELSVQRCTFVRNLAETNGAVMSFLNDGQLHVDTVMAAGNHAKVKGTFLESIHSGPTTLQ